MAAFARADTNSARIPSPVAITPAASATVFKNTRRRSLIAGWILRRTLEPCQGIDARSDRVFLDERERVVIDVSRDTTRSIRGILAASRGGPMSVRHFSSIPFLVFTLGSAAAPLAGCAEGDDPPARRGPQGPAGPM